MAASTHHLDYKLFIEILKDARKQIGVTQVELADRLGNTQTFISKIERGERRLDMVEFVEACEAIGVSPCTLLADFLQQRKQHHKEKSVVLKISKKR